jgi:ABC-type xylose transport system substrate-binding protein
MRIGAAVFAFLMINPALADSQKRVGLLWEAPPGDQDALAMREIFSKELTSRGFEVFSDIPFGNQTLAKAQQLISLDKVSTLIVRPYTDMVSYGLSQFGSKYGIALISVQNPIADKQARAFHVGFDPRAAGQLQIERLVEGGAKRLALLNTGNSPRMKSLLAEGQRRALHNLTNVSVIADCGTCPTTGDCPKASEAADCPCPRTGDCPKSSIANLFVQKQPDGVATLDVALNDIVDIAAYEAGRQGYFKLIGPPSASLDDLRGLAKGSGRAIIWQDPEALVTKTSEVVLALLAGTAPSKVAGASEQELIEGYKSFAVLLNPTVVDNAATASKMLRGICFRYIQDVDKRCGN